jgi:hypothetical protein
MRRFPLLLLLYVTMDFANPLMPGAVSFQAGSIEVVQGDRMARAARPVAAPASLPAEFPIWGAVPMGDTLARPVSLPSSPSSRVLRAVRRAPPQHFSAAPSPSEDH